jgi:hypothetical protein
VSSRDEDEAWRQIVANYGDVPSLDDAPRPEPREEYVVENDAPDEPDAVFPWEDEGRFVPPPPPPVPRSTPDRLAAWAGLFGAPLVLLVALVLNLSLPTWAGYVLVAWFVGGFLYLVVQMPSGPRDPGDDGARL